MTSEKEYEYFVSYVISNGKVVWNIVKITFEVNDKKSVSRLELAVNEMLYLYSKKFGVVHTGVALVSFTKINEREKESMEGDAATGVDGERVSDVQETETADTGTALDATLSDKEYISWIRRNRSA